MQRLNTLLLWLSLLVGSVGPFAALANTSAPSGSADISIPALNQRVTDLTQTLSAKEVQTLEQQLASFEQQKGSQLAVLIVNTTQPVSLEEFAIRVAEQWQLGRKGVDDGLILIVAKADRQLRIEVGYGLEGVIPDAIAKRVISEVIVPRFKENDYAGGITAGMNQLMALIDGEPLPSPDRQQTSSRGNDAMGMLLMAAMVVGQVLRSLLGPVIAGAIIGVCVFGVSWFITGALGMAVVIGLGGFFITLLGLMALLNQGGGRRGGLSGGFGGGGFGGGGGGFGGGGASGRW